VGLLAQSLGGGGHKKASGCLMEGRLSQCKQRIVKLINRKLKK